MPIPPPPPRRRQVPPPPTRTPRGPSDGSQESSGSASTEGPARDRDDGDGPARRQLPPRRGGVVQRDRLGERLAYGRGAYGLRRRRRRVDGRPRHRRRSGLRPGPGMMPTDRSRDRLRAASSMADATSVAGTCGSREGQIPLRCMRRGARGSLLPLRRSVTSPPQPVITPVTSARGIRTAVRMRPPTELTKLPHHITNLRRSDPIGHARFDLHHRMLDARVPSDGRPNLRRAVLHPIGLRSHAGVPPTGNPPEERSGHEADRQHHQPPAEARNAHDRSTAIEAME